MIGGCFARHFDVIDIVNGVGALRLFSIAYLIPFSSINIAIRHDLTDILVYFVN